MYTLPCFFTNVEVCADAPPAPRGSASGAGRPRDSGRARTGPSPRPPPARCTERVEFALATVLGSSFLLASGATQSGFQRPATGNAKHNTDASAERRPTKGRQGQFLEWLRASEVAPMVCHGVSGRLYNVYGHGPSPQRPRRGPTTRGEQPRRELVEARVQHLAPAATRETSARSDPCHVP